VHHFHTRNQNPDLTRRAIDDRASSHISWPNYHSGANGDYQTIKLEEPLHPVLAEPESQSGAIRYLPAHPHEGDVSAPRLVVAEGAVLNGTIHMTQHPQKAAHEAMARYQRLVRPDAPWCPDNVEFIRRVNDLDARADVFDIVTAATYLVLGLGDVYLGAPVATPLDPRHRLVTTKYNPARTWTPENAVGIGGAYLCIYGMEGPGGYQFVGRTVQVWSSSVQPPWLLRFFDRISWHPVSAEELLELRAEMAAGRLELQIEDGSFTLADHLAFLELEADGIAAFRERQTAAFAAERAAWTDAGELARQ